MASSFVSNAPAGAGAAPRQTRTVCPVCVRPLDGTIREVDGKALLCRTCPEHGPRDFLLSANGPLYRDLERFFFEVLGNGRAPSGRITNYWVLSTPRCQMNCAFCQTEVESPWFETMSLDDLRGILRRFGKDKLTLSGGEATLHPNAEDFFREAHALGLTTQLATNGILFARRDYCDRMAAAKLNEVRVSIESLGSDSTLGAYDDAFYSLKLKALQNLGELGIATVLSPTIFRGVNEDLLVEALEFARDKPFIRELSVNGFAWVGEGRGMDSSMMIMPDEMMDVLHRRYGSGDRGDWFELQKMMLAALNLMGVRLCLYTQIMIFVRRRGSLAPITHYLNMRRFGAALRVWERFARSPFAVRAFTFMAACAVSLRPRSIGLLPPLLKLAAATFFAIKIDRYPAALLPVVLNTNCTTLSADDTVSLQCMSGVLFRRQGAIRKDVSAELLLRKERQRGKREEA